MKRLVFEDGRREFFASHGLRGFDDFFHFNRCRIINQNSKRNVAVFDLDDNGRARTFYMKRFIRPHFKDMLSAFCRLGVLCSQAEAERRYARILLDRGIETYHPVCFGADLQCGLERQSFFVTEQINGPCLTDYLSRVWKTFGEAERNALAVELGQFFAKIHAAKIRLPDSYIWHIYRVEPNTGSHTLGIIDLHRMKTRTADTGSAAKDLGAFLFSLPDGFMDEHLREVFLKSYLAAAPIRNAENFTNKVKQWEIKISQRKKREVVQI